MFFHRLPNLPKKLSMAKTYKSQAPLLPASSRGVKQNLPTRLMPRWTPWLRNRIVLQSPFKAFSQWLGPTQLDLRTPILILNSNSLKRIRWHRRCISKTSLRAALLAKLARISALSNSRPSQTNKCRLGSNWSGSTSPTSKKGNGTRRIRLKLRSWKNYSKSIHFGTTTRRLR